MVSRPPVCFIYHLQNEVAFKKRWFQGLPCVSYFTYKTRWHLRKDGFKASRVFHISLVRTVRNKDVKALFFHFLKFIIKQEISTAKKAPYGAISIIILLPARWCSEEEKYDQISNCMSTSELNYILGNCLSYKLYVDSLISTDTTYGRWS